MSRMLPYHKTVHKAFRKELKNAENKWMQHALSHHYIFLIQR